MPQVPDELWPQILPIVRLPQPRSFTNSATSGTLLWVGQEEIVLADLSRKARIPDAVFLPTGAGQLESLAKRNRIWRFPVVEIERLEILPLVTGEGTPRCRLRVLRKGRAVQKELELAVDSVGVDAIRRLLGERAEVKPARPSTGFVVLGVFVLVSVSAIVYSITRTFNPVNDSAWGLWAGLFVVLPLLGIWFYLVRRGVGTTKPKRRRRPKSLRADRLPFRSVPLGWFLRLAGVILLILAFLGVEVMLTGGWILDQPSAPLGRDGVDVATLLLLGMTQLNMHTLALLTMSIPGLALLYLGHLMGQVDGERSLASDPRPRVLFLRSFNDDARYTFNEEGPAAEFLGLQPLFPWVPPPFRYLFNLYPFRVVRVLFGRGRDTAEEQLQAVFSRYAPLVAIGRPGEKFAAPGVPRIYVSHDAWQSQVIDLIQSAPLIILQPASTEGVWWEVEAVFREVPPQRVLICLGAAQTPDDFDITRARLNRYLPQPIFGVRPGHLFVWIDRAGVAHPEFLRAYHPLSWLFRSTTADLSTTLDRFLRSWQDLPPARSRAKLDRPPRRRPFAATVTVLLAFTGFFATSYAFNLVVMRLLSREPSSMLGAENLPVEGPGFSMKIRAGWQPVDLGISVLGDSRGFRLGQDCTLRVEIFHGLFRADLDGPEGLAQALDRMARSMADGHSGGIQVQPPVVIDDLEWTRGDFTVQSGWKTVHCRIWISRTTNCDHVVRFVQPAGKGDDDPVMRSVLETIASFRCTDPDVPFRVGDKAMSDGNLDLAIAQFRKTIQLDKKHPRAYSLLTQALLQTGDKDGALAALNSYVSDNPRSAMARFVRAGFHLQKPDGDLALADYSTAIDLDRTAPAAEKLPQSDLIQAYDYRALSRYRKGSYGEAVADYTKLLELRPADYDARVMRGNAYDSKGEFRKALEDYDAAVKLNPNLGSAYLERGIAWMTQRKYEKAAEDFFSCLQRDQANPTAINKLALINAAAPDDQLRDSRLAIRLATQACELTESKNSSYLETLAAAHAEADEFLIAVEVQERAIALMNDEANRKEAVARLAKYKNREPHRLKPPEGGQ